MSKLKKTSRGKLICIVLIILIFGTLVSFSYRIGYLPFVGNMIAEKKLTEYVHTQVETPQQVRSRFDWYNGVYLYDLTNGSTYSYELRNNTIHHEEVNKKVNMEANIDYKDVVGQFPSNLEFPDGISVWTSINADDYRLKAQRLYLLGIYNNENLTEEQSQRMPASIAENFIKLMGADYNFTGIQLNYADKNGMYEIAIPADTFVSLEAQELSEHTKKFSEDELPLDYLEWLNNK